jgi:hypothetical protein
VSLRYRGGRALLLWLVVAVSWNSSAPASAAAPQFLVDDQAVEVTAVRTSEDGEILVMARDLERIGIVDLRWQEQTSSAAMTAGDVTIEFRPGSRTARVTVIARSGRPVETQEPLAVPAELSNGHLMVPLFFVCGKLGVTIETRSRDVVSLRRPVPARTEDGAAEHARGTIVGRVLFNGLPLSGALLRPVRESDSAFVPDTEARTDANGRYRFAGLRPGRYRVYAYVGDNPDYFNRETATFTVSAGEVAAPTISMGRIIRPVRPLPQARIPFGERLRFEWTPCPGAASYEFTVTDPETHEEVAFKTVRISEAIIPGSALTPGRRYQCRVLGLNENSGFVGATPGMGAPPWVVVMIAYANSDAAGDSRKEE